MGGIKKEEFDIEFISRTERILKGYKGQLNITLLLNCLLGLIVLPSEYYNRKSRTFFDVELKDIPELTSHFTNIHFNPTKRKKNGWVADKKSLKNLIKKIRNGVSHQQIECIGSKAKWNEITIRDYNIGNHHNLELQVSWTPKQLKEFALYVAERYKSEISKLNNPVKPL